MFCSGPKHFVHEKMPIKLHGSWHIEIIMKVSKVGDDLEAKKKKKT